MLKSIILSLVAITLPVASAPTEASAATFTAWTEHNSCAAGGKDFYIPDGQCNTLPGLVMRVNTITDTCRLFIYKGHDCTGEEMQLDAYHWCRDIGDYYSIKAFCH